MLFFSLFMVGHHSTVLNYFMISFLLFTISQTHVFTRKCGRNGNSNTCTRHPSDTQREHTPRCGDRKDNWMYPVTVIIQNDKMIDKTIQNGINYEVERYLYESVVCPRAFLLSLYLHLCIVCIPLRLMRIHNTIRAFMCFCFQHSIVPSFVCTLFSPRCTRHME